MPQPLQHTLYAKGNAEQTSKQDFVSGLRGFLLNDMAGDMKTCFESELEPKMVEAQKKAETGEAVHRAIKSTNIFKFNSKRGSERRTILCSCKVSILRKA